MWKDFWQEQNSWDSDDALVVTDANGNVLHDGDNVAAIKDIKVKGASDIKRWDKFKNIRLTDGEDLIESGKMVLRTQFFKKI